LETGFKTNNEFFATYGTISAYFYTNIQQMPGYLLLRNNKESGPHSLEEMIALQLKQHDLIWVEGRSAAWRYPEELEEFKRHINISPVAVTEAKPAAVSEMYQHPASKKPAIPDQFAYVQASNVTKSEPPAPAPRDRVAKYISVIFPNSVKPVTDKKQPDTTSVPTEKAAPIAKEKIIVMDEARPTFLSKSFSSKFPERSLQASVKEDRNFVRANNLIWGVAILLGGVVLGLSLDNIFSTKPSAVLPSKPVVKQNILPVTKEEKTDINTNVVENNATTVTKDAELEEPVTQAVKKKPVKKNNDTILTGATLSQNPNSNEDNSIITPTPVKNDVVNEEKESAKSNIKSLLSVSNNKFKIGAFGGINELQISVTNNSHYPVDLIVVDVQYLLANKKIFKTETLHFRDLRPGVTLMQEAPKSPRGVKVEYSINSVNSKALGL